MGSRASHASAERAGDEDPVGAPPGPAQRDDGEGRKLMCASGPFATPVLLLEGRPTCCFDLSLPGLAAAAGGEEMNGPYQDEEGLWLRSRKDQPHATSCYLGR
jgi:hypothetical protein